MDPKKERKTAHMDHPDGPTPSVGRYLATRVTSLKPPMLKAPNPIRLIRQLNRNHWAFFFVAFWAWVRRCCAFHSIARASEQGLLLLLC